MSLTLLIDCIAFGLMSCMRLQNLITRPEYNGFEIERDNDHPVIIREVIQSFWIPVQERDTASKPKSSPFYVLLDNIEGETDDILSECFESLRQRICNASLQEITKETRRRKIHLQSGCPLFTMTYKLARRMDPQDWEIAMKGLENELRSQSHEKWMMVSNLMHEIGNHSSICGRA